jgi:DNA-binding NarL/FixJ family response regulator
MAIKVFLLDDHQMLIDGIKSLLKDEKDFSIIGEATRCKEAFDKIESLDPDIIISDINMPEMNGIEFTKKIKELRPSVKVLALSMFNDRSMIIEMQKAGVSGYILKNTGKQELIDALTKISEGGLFFSEEVNSVMTAEAGRASNEINITPREKEIIKLIAKEYSNSQIAEKLFISELTVETHRKNIFRKTNTKSVIGLLKFATENRIIE